MIKGLLISIAVGSVVGAACYCVASKKKKEETPEVKAVEPVAEVAEDDSVNTVDEPEHVLAEKSKPGYKKAWGKFKASVNKRIMKILNWISTNQNYLEAIGVVFTLATSANEFRKSIKPVTPIELTKRQVEDVVRTTFDGYLDTRNEMLKDDLKVEGVQEFLDNVAHSGGRVMKNSITGDRIECKLVKGGMAA